jgi:hypothetical protein
MSTPTRENANELPETETYARGARIANEALLDQHVREQWGPQLLRAVQLPPVGGLTRAGERFDDDDLPPPWLKPEHLIIPPAIIRRRERASRRRRNGILTVLIVGVSALPIAYYFVGGWQPRSETHPQLSSIVTKPATPPAPTNLPILAQDDEAGPLDANESASRAKPPQAARFSERLAMVFKPDDLDIGALSPNPAVRVLNTEAIMLLMKQGEELVEVGDFATARPLFQRAAEADDATASLALGATYDPAVLAGMRTVGIDADVAKARFWYQKAVSLGSAEAKRRLELLANR